MRRPHESSALLVFAALAVAQCSLSAQFCADKLGPEFEVLPNLPGHQELSDRGNALVVDPNEDAVLGFKSNHLSNAADPFIQRFDTDGALIGPTIHVNPSLNSFDGPPTLALAPDGTLIAAWPSNGPDGDGEGIFARFFDNLGDPLGPEFQVNQSFQGGQVNPRVGIDHAGNAAILWGDHGLPNSETRLVLRIFAPWGVPLTGEVEVARNTGAPSLAMTHDGLVLVVWGTRTAGWDIMGRYYDIDGVSLTAAPFVIDDDPGFNHHAGYARTIKSGEIVVTWQSFGQSGKELRMQRLAPGLMPSVGPTVVADYNYTEEYPVKVDGTADGKLAFVWHAFADGLSPEIFARLFDPTDQPLGPVFKVNTIDNGFEWFPSIAVADDDHFVAVWQSRTAPSSSTGRIKAQWFGCPNSAPTADAGSDIEVHCHQTGGTMVMLDGTGSFDPDGDLLTFHWSVAEDAIGSPLASLDDPNSPTPSGLFPLGETLVTLTVTDPSGAFDTDDVRVSVIDDVPPLASCTTDLGVLWPPNHGMVPITITLETSDTCTAPEALLVTCHVSSNEPDDGTGDGAFTGDVDGNDGYTTPAGVALAYDATLQAYTGNVLLRAERDGAAAGRVYSIVCEVEDLAGNETTTSCVVVVPKSRRGFNW